MTLHTGDDPQVARALRASVLLRAVDAIIATVWSAAGESRTGQAATRLLEQWWDHAPAERLTVMGMALLSASVVTIGLTVTHEVPPGWLWLMPPAIASTIGLVFLAARRDPKA